MDKSILTYATLVLCVTIFVRLFTYQRGDARFRRDVSIAATLIMACCGSQVIYILAGHQIAISSWPMVTLLAVLTASLLRSEGNLSKVLRYPLGWDGRDRRNR
jgi:hypothetical protein